MAEWIAYERVAGPIGAERADIQTALLATVMSNMWRGKKSRRFKLRDFIPRWDKPQQTPDQMLAMVKALNAMAGGTVKKEE